MSRRINSLSGIEPLFVRQAEGEGCLSLAEVQVEVAEVDDVHPDDGVAFLQFACIHLLVGDDVARRQHHVHEICAALRLAADALHAALPEQVGAQFADESRGEDGGVAARVPHRADGLHPALLVEADELALGDHLVGQRAEVLAIVSHPLRGVQIPQ